jgi:putative oxidoreductase
VLGRYSEQVFTVTRIVFGVLFACHGAQKLFGVLGGVGGAGKTVPLASLFGLAGTIEFFGGVLIAIGFMASYAAFIAAGEMAVAYFMVHARRAPWPIQNLGEPAVLYCFAFLYIAARGAGRWSVDAALLGRTSRPSGQVGQASYRP